MPKLDTVLHGRSRAAALLMSTALTGFAVPAFAQDEEAGLIPEVTVTAEFRAASLQDTPISITAVNAAMLEARSQTNVAQITSQTPNVSLRPAGSAFGSALVAFIRGVGQTDFNPSVEPGVGIYVDEVYYATLTGNLLDLLDIDRVEVLRGPQGTLAGRNAIGGAIKLFTRKPDGSDDGFVSATYGEFDRVDVRAAAGLTLVPDKLYARIAGASRTSDGYVTRYDYACTNGGARILPDAAHPDGELNSGLPTYSNTNGCELGKEGGQSYTAARVALRWIVTPTFEVNLVGAIVNDDSESQPGVLVRALDHSTSLLAGGGSLVPIWYDNYQITGCGTNGVFDAACDVPFDSRFETGGTYYNYATYIDDGLSTPDPGFAGAELAGFKPYIAPPINHLKTIDTALNVEWQILENLSLLSVTAYREYDNAFSEDTDGSPLAVQQLLQRMVHSQWTQEVRFNATLFSGLLDATAGYFYLDQKTNEDARVDLPYVGFDFIHGPDKVPATSEAVYGHLTLHPWDRMDISAGVRYTTDEKSYTFARHNPDGTVPLDCGGLPFFFSFVGALFGPNCAVGAVNGISVSYESERLDWRGAIDFDVTDDFMVYGQVATGYKGGGNNARPFFPSQLNAFDPEILTSYEAGFKSTWSGRVRLNGSYFYNVYKDIQLPANTCVWADAGETTPCASQNNVGDAHVWGIELESEIHFTDAFLVDASYSYLNFEYQTIKTDGLGVPLTDVLLGMVPPYTPENKWSIGAQYEFPFLNLGTITPRIDVSFQDDVYADAVNAAQNQIEAYTIANARVTWKDPDELWSAALEVTNLTDEYYYLTLFDLLDGAAGYLHGQPARPREWAVTLKRKF